jgi:hypothetical protein
MRVPWRKPRSGHEKEDQAHNEHLAERLLSDPATDDYIIAFGVLDWCVLGPHGERWMMHERRVLTPSWAQSVVEAERAAYAGAHVVADIDKHRPRPRASKMEV